MTQTTSVGVFFPSFYVLLFIVYQNIQSVKALSCKLNCNQEGVEKYVCVCLCVLRFDVKKKTKSKALLWAFCLQTSRRENQPQPERGMLNPRTHRRRPKKATKLEGRSAEGGKQDGERYCSTKGFKNLARFPSLRG